MTIIKRFWRSLELMRGCTTLPAEWRRLMGENYAVMNAFFRPSGELATWFPHPDPDQLYYRVVTHGTDDHVGVSDETGERVILRTADLVLMQLDRVAIERAVAKAIDVEYQPESVESFPGVHYIGHAMPLAGYRFPVFWTIQSHPTDFERVVSRLVATEESPFFLLTPSCRFVTREWEDLFRGRRACFFPLDECIGLSDDGSLAVTQRGRLVLDAFLDQVIPKSAPERTKVFFPTPSGTTWSQVEIRMLDGHRASVAVGPLRRVLTFTQMGMVNRKNGNPSVQWELLRIFAAGHGVLTWRSSGADRKNQKRRELLAKHLREFFRISTDPFLASGNGWRARFSIDESQ